MDINYFAFFLISLIPLIIGLYWYHPGSFISRYSKLEFVDLRSIGVLKVLVLCVLSFALVYGYMNLTIHQLGFYELFFTDLIFGSEEAEIIVSEFLAEYGSKHRHFGHGVFHGVINAFVIALPFVGFNAILAKRDKRYVIHHFSYWLITSVVVSACISEFV